jgi:hypothetical protein
VAKRPRPEQARGRDLYSDHGTLQTLSAVTERFLNHVCENSQPTADFPEIVSEATVLSLHVSTAMMAEALSVSGFQSLRTDLGHVFCISVDIFAQEAEKTANGIR